jgi:tRNA(Ile)-lysidine synthase
MPHPLESQLAEAWPPADWADVTIVIALSGGGDSVALLRAMVAIKAQFHHDTAQPKAAVLPSGRICAAHLNHQLRPAAAADEQFVVELCRRLGVTFEVGHMAVDRLADGCGDGIEAAARTARYRFIQQTAGRLGARFVVTAHTADDQAETILHRIVRGTGIRGLSGMARVRPLGHATLIRPLLDVRRADLQAYLDALGQPYRHDQSNFDLRFTRNRIRHETMPQLREKYNAGVTEALLRLGALAGEAQAVVDDLVEDLFSRYVTVESPETAHIELAGLANRSRYLVRELLMTLWRRQDWPLQAMGRQKWEELSTLALAATTARRVFPGAVMAEVAEGQMQLQQSHP